MGFAKGVRGGERSHVAIQAAGGVGAEGVFLYSKALMRQNAPMPALEVLAPVTINGAHSHCTTTDVFRPLALMNPLTQIHMSRSRNNHPCWVWSMLASA